MTYDLQRYERHTVSGIHNYKHHQFRRMEHADVGSVSFTLNQPILSVIEFAFTHVKIIRQLMGCHR